MPDQNDTCNNQEPEPNQSRSEAAPRCNSGDDDDGNSGDKSAENEVEEDTGPKSLKDELEVEDLSRCIYFKDSKIFAAAGPGLPLLQVNTDGTFVSLAPDLPYRQEVDEDMVVKVDEHGRLLDPLGQLRKLTGMKYKGKLLYHIYKRHPENNQHLAAWFDDDWKPHFLYLGETILSAAMVLKIRNRMIDGELGNFEEISSD